MKKASALIISILFVAAIFLLSQYERSNENLERVVIEKAIDGDTVEIDDGRTIRLININTPERGERYYGESRDYLKKLENRSVDLEITGTEKYGRLLGRIYSPEYINLEIVRNGFAHSFLVAEKEVNNFKIAQNSAFTDQRGIWSRSPDYGCLEAQINKKEEYIDLMRKCDVAIKGWTISDESTKRYEIRSEFDSIRLYSEKGKDDQKTIYWGEGNVWNDDRDSLFIRDQKGLLIYYLQYGY